MSTPEDAERFVLELQHDRPPAAARLTGTDLGHQPGGKKVLDEIGDRRTRDLGVAREVRSRHPAQLPDHAEQQV